MNAVKPSAIASSYSNPYNGVRDGMRSAPLQRRIDPSYTSQSIDMVNGVDTNFDWSQHQDPNKKDLVQSFDWSQLQEPKLGLVKDYVQTYGAESFIDDSKSDILSDTASTPSLITDQGSSIDLKVNAHEALTDIFDSPW